MTTSPIALDDGDPLVVAEGVRLACGLEVILHHDAALPRVAALVAYRVGSSDELPGQHGMAHLFEHLFKNSKHLGARKHYEVLREAGASSTNASTGPDRTTYHEVLPSHQAALALWLESDRMGYVADTLTPDRVAAQQQVVLAEREQRYLNQAYGPTRLAIAAQLYPPSHPHHDLTIGRAEDIAACDRAALLAFYRTYYVPANAVLVLAGDLRVGQADALLGVVDRYFGSFPTSQRPPRQAVALPPWVPASHALIDRLAQVRRLQWVWRAPVAQHPDQLPVEMLAAALAKVGLGPLWKALVYERGLALRVGAYTSHARLAGELHIVVELRPEASLAETRAVLGEVIAEVLAEGLPPQLLARMVERRRAARIWGTEQVMARAQRLVRHALWDGAEAVMASQREHVRRLRGLDAAALVRAIAWLQPAPLEFVTLPT